MYKVKSKSCGSSCNNSNNNDNNLRMRVIEEDITVVAGDDCNMTWYNSATVASKVSIKQ